MARQPGTLDPAYGRQGIADIPTDPPVNPDARSLQVMASAGQGASLAFCGTHPADAERVMLVRLLEDGQPDPQGPVVIEPHDAHPESSLAFVALQAIPAGAQTHYLAIGTPAYYDFEAYQLLNYVSIGRYDEHFEPIHTFGKQGVALPDPGDNWAPVLRLSPSAPPLPQQHPARAYPRGRTALIPPFHPATAVTLTAGLIRVVFSQKVYDDETSVETYSSHVTLVHPDSGEPVAGLGEHLEHSVLRLDAKDGTALQVLGARFLEDGGFIVLAHRSDNRVIVKRYRANGLADENFAGGEEELNLFGFVNGLQPGLEVRGERILVSRAIYSQRSQGTTVFCHTLSGLRDQTFNGGQALTVQRGPRVGLSLNQVKADEQGRVVLAGSYMSEGLDQLCVVRLTASGALDESFGDAGFFDSGRDLFTASGLYPHTDGIRVLSQFPTFTRSFLERVAKLVN